MAVLSGLFHVSLFIVLGMYNFGQRIAFAISQIGNIAAVTQRLDFLMLLKAMRILKGVQACLSSYEIVNIKKWDKADKRYLHS